jgi:carboxymethylenebutenolidase
MANVRTSDKEVSYPGEAGTIKAFTANSKESGGAKPVVIVVQEWWGLNDHVKDVARRFAAEGYFAIAPDLYSRQGNKVTKDPDEAGNLMAGLATADGIDDLLSTLDWIKMQPAADAKHIGIVGFCMGGSYATLLPCVSKDIKAAAAFYGEVAPDDQLANINCPIFYVYGVHDDWIERKDVDRLARILKRLSKPGEVKIYPNSSHGFFNDTRDVYNPVDAKDAWDRTLKLFDANLKA